MTDASSSGQTQQFRTPYQMLGEEKIRELAAAVYGAMDHLPQAAAIRAMHGDDLAEIKVKLGDWLIGWMGGPPIYAKKTGTICLTKPHKPYAIGPAERGQWLQCFEAAMAKVDLDPKIREMLREPISGVADMVQNRKESPCGSAA
jgi:hemoglobin